MANKTNKIRPRKLNWPQLNRLADIYAYGPCHSLEGDEELIVAGLARFYDDDPEYIEGVPGTEDLVYEPPFYRVRDRWRTDEEPPAPEINCNAAKLQILYGARITSSNRSESNHQEVKRVRVDTI